MKPVIVYVDDEPHNLAVFEALLPDEWEIHVFESPLAALEKIQELEPMVIFSDQRMPHMNGVKFLEQASEMSPDAVQIIVTGFSDEDQIIELVRRTNISDYIRKPWDPDDLESRAEKALEKYQLTRERNKFAAELEKKTEELEKKNKALQRLEERFAKAFHSSPDAVAITRLADGRYIDVNDSFLRLTGFCRDEMIGRTSVELDLWVEPSERESLIQMVCDQRSIHDVDSNLRTKSGEIREMRFSIELIELEQEPCVLVIVHDITEHKGREAQLRQVQKLEAIGALAGGIAHDFNNILGAMVGYTELVLDEVGEGGVAEGFLQEVLTAGQRAKDLVQQILTFSRQTEQEYKPVALHPILKEALMLLRVSFPTTVEIRQYLDTDAGAVLADPTQLYQVVMNLGTNAAHAMRETGGVLEVRLNVVEVDARFALQHAVQPGPHVRLTVHDTGHGMAPEVLARVFEPFFTTKAQGEGTGMGLAVLHGIVSSHGGAVTVASTLGEGTTFEVYLPLIDAVARDTAQPQDDVAGGQERILFVDDEPPLARLGQEMLARLGYEVVAHTNSMEALEAFRTTPECFDLVITDQTMPQMTGESFSRELQQIRPDIPIILCTGFSHTMTAEKAQALGLNALCSKPLVARDLAQVVRRALARHTMKEL